MKGLSPKVYSIILFALMGISGLLYILFALEIVPEGLLLNWCYLLFGIAAIAAIVFPIIGMVSDFAKAKRSLIGVGVLILLFVIGYAMSSEEVYKIGERVVEGAVSKQSEAGLITFYAMIMIAIGSIVFTEVSKAFK